jgi:hypothetical protein
MPKEFAPPLLPSRKLPHRSHWYAEGGYDPNAEKLLGVLEADGFSPRIRRRTLGYVRTEE